MLLIIELKVIDLGTAMNLIQLFSLPLMQILLILFTYVTETIRHIVFSPSIQYNRDMC